MDEEKLFEREYGKWDYYGLSMMEIAVNHLTDWAKRNDWRDLRMCVFDYETTDIDPETAEPTQFYGSLIRLQHNSALRQYEPEELDSFGTLINPGIPISEEVSKITGITDEMVQDAPTFAEAWEGIKDIQRRADVLVAYNGLNYDYKLQGHTLERYGIDEVIFKPMIDPIIWFRDIKGGGFSKTRLSDAARAYSCSAGLGQVAYGISALHDAKVDTDLLSQLLGKMAKQDITAFNIIALIAKQEQLYTRQRMYELKQYGPKEKKGE